MTHTKITRRSALLTGLAGAAALPASAQNAPSSMQHHTTVANTPATAQNDGAPALTWADLIPAGTPYSEIIGDGYIDRETDLWKPQFDEHGTKLVTDYDNRIVQLAGFIVPYLPAEANGLTKFLLAPRQSICTHVPPPPPNQIAMAHASLPVPQDLHWSAVRVTGVLTSELQSMRMADVGYRLEVTSVERFL